jgi:hypothetical protein
MAATYRFGFEGQQVPNGVSLTGEYAFVPGRSGTGSYACSPYGSGTSSVEVYSPIPINVLYTSFYWKIDATGSGVLTDLVNFGAVRLAYSASQGRMYLYGNNVFLTSASFSIPYGVYIPVKFRGHVASSGASVALDIDGNQMTFIGNTQQGAATLNPPAISFGLGEYNGTKCRFHLDDVAVNDTVNTSNVTGSWGSTADSTYPPMIRADRVLLRATASGYGTWQSTDFGATAREILNGGYPSQYAYSPSVTVEDRFTLQTASADVIGVEGVNLYALDVIKQGGSNPYFTSYILSGSQRYNYDQSYITNTSASNDRFSILRKDLGGTISLDEYSALQVGLNTRIFENDNFFGRGTLGNVHYTSNYNVPSTLDGDFVVLEYENLTIASGVTFTVSNRCKGLIIYVKENCIINGTLSMTARGSTGSLSGGIRFFKNTTSSFDVNAASLAQDLTLPIEQLFQPIQQGTSASFSVPQTGAAGAPRTTLQNQAGIAGTAGTNGQGGGGGSGGNSYNGNNVNVYGGAGASGGTFGGGSAGGGAGNVGNNTPGPDDHGNDASALSGPGGDGGSATYSGGGGAGIPGGTGPGIAEDGQTGVGGVLYIVVGNFLYIGPSGVISSNGSLGGLAAVTSPYFSGNGGSSGGGPITVLYGRNLFNNGSIQANGGTAVSFTNTISGGAGGAGSIRIAKIRTLQ